MRATGQVRRGVNPLRLAALGFIVATSLGVGALVSWWAGILTFAGLGIIFAIPRTRHLLMEFAHRLTGA